MITQNYNNSDSKTTNKQNICLKVVEQARDQRHIRAIACFYLLKQRTSKSILLHYRQRTDAIAALAGISTRTLYTYMKIWQRMGLIIERGSHCQLVATQRTKTSHKESKRFNIAISDNETIDTIEARLNGQLIEQHAHKKAYNIKIEEFLRKGRTGRTAFNVTSPESPAAPSLSIRSAMKLLNMSQVKTVRTLQMLNSLGIINTIPSKPRLLAQAPASALKYADIPAYCFHYKGAIYAQTGNLHELLEHPINTKPATYMQFKHAYKSGFCKKQYNY